VDLARAHPGSRRLPDGQEAMLVGCDAIDIVGGVHRNSMTWGCDIERFAGSGASRRAESGKPARRWIVAICLLALLAAACGSSSGSKATSTTTPPATRRYSAVGDSYASGEGLFPFEADSSRCHRSPQGYPRLVANQAHAALTSGACTGATVSDVVGPGGQVDTVDPEADLVTVTIGGNDAGFATVVGDCVAGPLPCSRLDAEINANLAKLEPALEAAYRQLHQRAPKARLVVVGYPQVVADPATVNVDTCKAVSTPVEERRVTSDDARWMRDKGAALSAVISKAAKAAGARYVDVAADFAGHEACSAKPWLSGFLLTDIVASFHPTAAGQVELAKLVTQAIS